MRSFWKASDYYYNYYCCCYRYYSRIELRMIKFLIPNVEFIYKSFPYLLQVSATAKNSDGKWDMETERWISNLKVIVYIYINRYTHRERIVDRVQQYEARSFHGSDKNRRKRKVSVSPCQYIYTAHATEEVTGRGEKTLNVGKPNNLVLIRSTTISHNNANNAGIGTGNFQSFISRLDEKSAKPPERPTYVRTYGPVRLPYLAIRHVEALLAGDRRFPRTFST